MSSPTRPDMIGRTLMSKLKVLRVLGAGGMGTVFEVEHLITRHHRALKVLHAQHEHSHETVARFIREAGVAGTLKTPYVVETYDAGTMEDGSAYVLMELLEGKPLSALLETEGRVTPGRIVGICCQVLEGLSVAHDAGVIHRDIKPDNIFLLRDEKGRERVKLLDFGISKFTQGVKDYAGTLTGEGTMMGTPYYMSPEQASGARDIDERTDLYSVGVILYEALAGRRPFDGQTLAALVIRIHKGECDPLAELAPFLAPGLAAVVARAMASDRDQRYRTARELLAALVPYAESGYVASLATLRESRAEAPTISRDAIPVVGTLAETLPAPVPVMSLRPPAPLAESIEVDLGTTADVAREDGAKRRPGWATWAAIAAAVVVVAGAIAVVGSGSGARSGTGTGSGTETGIAGTGTVGAAPAPVIAPAPAPVIAPAPAPEIAPAPEVAQAPAPAPEIAPAPAPAAEGEADDDGPESSVAPATKTRPTRPVRPRPERPGIERDNPYGE